MSTIAFLFPGQGSQHKGMGLDYCESYPIAAELYQRAEAVLGWSVKELSTDEKADQLGITLYTQPCLYTMSCVVTHVLEKEGLIPTLTAGHSAGEFAALTAAGAWDFETGLKLIAERARLMHETAKPGAMAAVLGMKPELIAETCGSVVSGIVQVANYNSPKQTVITGEKEAISEIRPLLKDKGARRVVPLKVSGAFHSPLMNDAQDAFRSFMEDYDIADPKIPWVSNNTGEKVTDGETIRKHLVNQFCEPVRWTQCMTVIENECRASLEAGTGEVLAGLTKACCSELKTLGTDSVEKLLETIAELKA